MDCFRQICLRLLPFEAVLLLTKSQPRVLLWFQFALLRCKAERERLYTPRSSIAQEKRATSFIPYFLVNNLHLHIFEVQLLYKVDQYLLLVNVLLRKYMKNYEKITQKCMIKIRKFGEHSWSIKTIIDMCLSLLGDLSHFFRIQDPPFQFCNIAKNNAILSVYKGIN